MLKFFRRIRQNLLSENKFSKYLIYAIGEIILVMIGILLALQVNNWNNNRIERTKEANYIENINREFKSNRAQLDSAIFYHQKVHLNTTKILNLVPVAIDTFNKDSLSFYISETFNHHTFNPQQSTINSLTNTSSFEVISNLELRGLLQQWDELVKDYREEEIVAREHGFDKYVPYFEKHISFLAYSNNDNIFNQEIADYSFLKSLEFANAIALKREFVRDILFGAELKEVNATIDRIIELTSPQEK
ncbi:DUF6090 family protein [Croceivirga thetidis]|uniref:Uncharacterized protein n=1 Tax=Croceivirga thetidis TaxID=2721623 RepID=A0ABX1GLF8_9FLAO|nr:DUF6090 family protein [Croceivirga thetidis]NKI30424.1 hypothetical protein [Croceivirga thetidis]